MPININNVVIGGTLTRDPEIRFFANEKAVANFGLAINRKYRGSDGEMKEDTCFVDVETWSRQAELCGQFLTKGAQCVCIGELKQDTWEDQQGKKRSKLKVNARNVQFVGTADRSKQQGNGQQQPANNAPAVPPPTDLGDQETPF
jgi:single-strand DNA-binding protein